MQLDAADLEFVVARALGVATAIVADWCVDEIFAGDGQGLGVFRVNARACAAEDIRPCSVILKVLPAGAGEARTAWSHPAREAHAYETGLLKTLPPGLRAPRCFAHRQHGGRHFLWLEDLGDEAPRWTLDDYAAAARHLGRFNGAYLTGTALPDLPWLSRGWLRSWLAEGASAMEDLHRHRAEPLVQRVYTTEVLEVFADLWTRREMLLCALDGLRQVLCHQDAFRRNLFLRRETLVAVDWAFVGPGPIGGELAPLVTASAAFLAVERGDWTVLERTALDAYRQGLVDAGWDGPPEHPQFGFVASSALRYGPGVVRLMLPTLLDEAAHRRTEQVLGIPFDDIVDLWAAVAANQAQLATQAFSLLRGL
jgi:Phosphotransferase enzyme family